MGSPKGTSSLTTGNFSPIIDHCHPLYMYPSDAPRSLSAGIELVIMENYTIWSRSMKVALLGRNKLGFIDGSIVRDDYSGDLAKDCYCCNANVFSWLMGNVHRNLLVGILFCSSEALIWKDLKERFDKVNDSRAYIA
ncbi:uncharacterized protein LOC142176737 [Nicotiana tabacum]|uniref:Uncharacterized protein LOC142176737 n=1 Tax=Nicotiana tabacum TaxID=4097 RepID=A0AC58TV24_TOBAC